MSYTSGSKIPSAVSLAQVRELVTLLGYKKIVEREKVPGYLEGYMWFDHNDYRSHVGVELSIWKRRGAGLTVETRSRVGRSYWDLAHQNYTLKTMRDLLGASFTTDAGSNRYWHPDEPPPAPIASGCYMARWKFHNDLQRARIYLQSRKLEGDIARDGASPFWFLDEINPRLLSNNLLMPYVFAVWEEYFRATFTACLKYTEKREAALKKARLGHADLEKIALGDQPIERAIAESFSFQRPSAIQENFRMLDPKLDLAAALRRPYRRRKASLYTSIELLVENRNEFVHTGSMNMTLFDKQLKAALGDIEAAVNIAYSAIAEHYKFTPSHDY